MKRLWGILAFVCLSGLLVVSSYAGGGLGGGATEFTQIANNSELVAQVGQLAEQINNQITMINDMIRNTLALPNQLVGTVKGQISQVMQAYNQVQGVLNRLSNIDEEFYDTFYSSLSGATSSTGWTENYSKKYFELSEAIEKEAKKTVESLKVSADDITDSERILKDLMNNASSAGGRNAIQQASNEFLGFMSGELIKVRTLLAEQTKSYLDYAERQRSLEDAGNDLLRKNLDNWKEPTHKPETFYW